MLAENVRFDDNPRASRSERPTSPGGAIRAIRDLADRSGLDPVADLFNEARQYAEEGHLRNARERLHILLGLAPEDGQARLLLARVHVAGQRWQDALQALDEAQECGEHVPAELRKAVEEHLRADRAAEEEQTAALRARELGEVKALRQEARRLRTENAQLLGLAHDREREARKWAWTTSIVSVSGILFAIVSFLIGGDPEPVVVLPSEVPAAQIAPATTPPAPRPLTAAAAPVEPVKTSSAEIAERAKEALSSADGLEDTALELTVRGTAATVTGEVLTAKQRRRAAEVLENLSGMSKVDVSGVRVLARRKGAEHEVGPGDTLGRISLEYYGEAKHVEKIREANKATLKGGSDLKLKQTLKIPPVE
jgi:nucleoid-associated protein YgaU